MRHAIVEGAQGRVGRAFADRLERDGWKVWRLDREGADVSDIFVPAGEDLYLFDCAYQHGDPWGHVERVVQILRDREHYAGIFIPSSWHLGDGSPYGTAKLAIEQLAKLYRMTGARIVVDRIGYFPGEDVEPCPRDPFIDKLVTADDLYARVMAAMLA